MHNLSWCCFELIHHLTDLPIPKPKQEVEKPPRLDMASKLFRSALYHEEIYREKLADNYYKFERTFKFLACNKHLPLKHVSQYLITEKSYSDNILDVLGHDQKFVAMRVFSILLDLCPIFAKDRPGGISYVEWFNAILSTIYNPDPAETSRFIFMIYDVDNDGEISSNDLNRIYEYIDAHSPLGLELRHIFNQIVRKQITSKKKLDMEKVDLRMFRKLISSSCLLQELKDRMIQKPMKPFRMPSVTLALPNYSKYEMRPKVKSVFKKKVMFDDSNYIDLDIEE